jgi:hypothetical protein
VREVTFIFVEKRQLEFGSYLAITSRNIAHSRSGPVTVISY